MSGDTQVVQLLEHLVGRVIGRRYRIDGLLDVGGMGAVFRGDNLETGQDIAIKVLRPDLSQNAEAVARFDREARLGSRFDHPNCLRVTDLGATRTGTRYMVMPLLEGHPLTRALVRRIPLARAFNITLQLLEGLHHVHGHGIVHRDIKPDNVFLTFDDDGGEIAKIVDFGIARMVEGDDKDHFNTRMGLVIGTPSYMSPEQASGLQVDARADIYSTGLVLYEMLAGAPAFQHSDPLVLVRMQVGQRPKPLPSATPPIVAAIVERMLAKVRADRFQTAAEATQALIHATEMIWPGQGFADALRKASPKPTPRDRPRAPSGPAEASDAHAFDDALKALLAKPTPLAVAELRPGIGRARSITEVSGIDMDNLQLQDVAAVTDPDE